MLEYCRNNRRTDERLQLGLRGDRHTSSSFPALVLWMAVIAVRLRWEYLYGQRETGTERVSIGDANELNRGTVPEWNELNGKFRGKWDFDLIN